DEDGVFARQHERDAALGLLFDSFDGGERRMPGHGTSVAKTQVDVAVTVHVIEMRALCFANEGGKGAGPLDHPVHGNASEERLLAALEQGLGFGAFVDEFLLLALHEGCETAAIDGGHGFLLRPKLNAAFFHLRMKWNTVFASTSNLRAQRLYREIVPPPVPVALVHIARRHNSTISSSSMSVSVGGASICRHCATRRYM